MKQLTEAKDTQAIFYVYALLDNRKPGKFIYDEYVFECEPFYIGKGKGNRMNFHFFESRLLDTNKLKVNLINKIIRETGETPMIKILSENTTEIDAHNLEIKLIKLIGRRDKKNGTLSNLTNGGEGQSGSLEFIGDKNPFFGKTHKKESYKNVVKPVKQFSIDGVLIKEFDSIKDAAIETNSIDTKISMVARGLRNVHNGYKWEFVNNSDINNNNKSYKKVDFLYVEKIDIKTGEIVCKYETVTEAAKSVGATTDRLSGCLKGNRNTSCGFRWKYKLKDE